ncbi:MAG TPA: glycosyl hydrolase family 28-related protein [Gaiellaceae bacterium]|nr:glycosyl hydrolase family 28-related protein [Gaiellaceae bacterium]
MTVISGTVHDRGGQVFDVRNSLDFGAAGDGTTDDTNAIAAAIAAAEAVQGTVFVPPGTYLITGQLTLSGPGGLTGAGGNPGSSGAATVFLCGSSSAGILVAGPGTYQGFCVDADGTATTPLQVGTLSGGDATDVGSYSTFVDVWVTDSAGNGWTIYGAQANSFYDCGATGSTDDGVYVDGGAGGLCFWGFLESGSGRYGVHAGVSVTGGSGTRVDRTEGVRFYGGSLRTKSTDPAATSKVYLRGAYDWKFRDVTIVGDNLSGPTVDLDQSAGELLDFSSCRISATVTGNHPGIACIDVSGTPPTGADALPFLITDKIRFTAGDTSVYIDAAGNYTYQALDWILDATDDGTNGGPAAGTGLDVNVLLVGRAGKWQDATSLHKTGWDTSGVSYRRDALGHVELKGTATYSSGGTGAILQLPAGYRPAATVHVPVALASGTPTDVTVASDGTVTGVAQNLHLDGIRFPVD